MTCWTEQDATAVRARMAAAWLGRAAVPSRLGSIDLRDYQRDAAARLRHALDRYGGALLADDVGLGKTYTALAATAACVRLLIVAPASLRLMWRRALSAVCRTADVVSFESLSRSPCTRLATRYDSVIIDEAHHARNPSTRRYGRLASITVGSRVLLLTATPVHNATRDLHALLALFLGSRAGHLTARELGACIVRRTRADVPVDTTPARAPPEWLELPPHAVDGAVLDAVLRIPPACPPRDGSEANALVTLGLVRAWSSTDAALRTVLRRRLARAESLSDALAAGRHPTRAELQAWVVGDDATQLAFPELIAPESTGLDGHELLAVVRAHAAGVRSALRALEGSECRPDDARRDLLRRVRAGHAGESIVVFSQYAESVQAMFRRLARDGGVAAVTARAAVVAGGTLPRHVALARFAPNVFGTRPPRRAEAISLLLATDLLSEGLNLQEARVVIHLDLPWTPARLAQRMGRVWRIGSQHAQVFEYAIAPPASGAGVLPILEHLDRKARASRMVLGTELTPLVERDAGLSVDPSRHEDPGATPAAVEALRRAMSAWAEAARDVRRMDDPDDGIASGDGPRAVIAAVRGPIDGWLAVVETASETRLVAKCRNGDPTCDPATVLAVVRAASGATRPPRRLIERAKREAGRYVASMQAAGDAGLDTAASLAHARITARIGELVGGAAAHRRSTLANLAASARQALAAVRGVGAERVLRDLASSCPADARDPAAAEWLLRLARVARETHRAGSEEAAWGGSPRITALLVLVSEPA